MDASGDPVGHPPAPATMKTVEELLALLTETAKSTNEEHIRLLEEQASLKAELAMFKNACDEYEKMVSQLLEDEKKKEAAMRAMVEGNYRIFHETFMAKETAKALQPRVRATNKKRQQANRRMAKKMKTSENKRKKNRTSPPVTEDLPAEPILNPTITPFCPSPLVTGDPGPSPLTPLPTPTFPLLNPTSLLFGGPQPVSPNFYLYTPAPMTFW